MSHDKQRRPNVNHFAPVGSVDLRAFDDEGNSFEIFACIDCLPWYAEVVRDEEEVLVREWHAVECPQFKRMIADE
ncbi:hypothetical protein [Streptomyces zaomyceticus]|uniref:hypothetical protein n=1 Tax=Streptomyces zaomyceticus TaxID=68286 RepID=UPI0037AE62BF